VPPSMPRAFAESWATRQRSAKGRGPGRRLTWAIVAALAVVGLLDSGYLLFETVRGSPPVCLVGSCAEVAASLYSRFLGLPMSAWGVAMYLTVAAAAVAGIRLRTLPAWLPVAFVGLAVFGVTFSGYLVWLQLVVIRAVCSWCALSATVWLSLLAVGLWIVRRPA
jgi:uncharacterized membrane protein